MAVADKTLLILKKLPALSHLKERKDTNCLNCNARVYGKYCHICGQENIEPAESAWHLVTHFFNDITHFDGKFFSTLKLLITKPGFLSAEYKRGRRASYLNPVRMYIFSSFVFFIIVFKLFPAEGAGFNSVTVSGYTAEQIRNMDSTEFAVFTKTLTQGKRVLSKAEYPAYLDSVLKSENYYIFSRNYKTKGAYDSLVKAGKVNETWLEEKVTQKEFELRSKYRNQRDALRGMWDKFMHTFPQVLFITLPFFAMLLSLLYIRRKDFYFVSHGIYSIHLFIFYFIVLLALFGLGALRSKTGWILIDWMEFVLSLLLLLYEYKAMRAFYGQGRAKTFLKFLLAFLGRLVIMIILVTLFALFSIYTL